MSGQCQLGSAALPNDFVSNYGCRGTPSCDSSAFAAPAPTPTPRPSHFRFSPLPPAHHRQKPISIHSSSRRRRFASNMGHNRDDHVTGDWYAVPDLKLRDHRFIVPLDYSSPHTSHITVFAREVVAGIMPPSTLLALPPFGKEEQPLPYLLFLQGGPGFESPRPTESSGWIKRACEEFRRGTGLSSPLTVSSLSQMRSAQHVADYLKHFRADNIVNDAEFIRVRLVPDGGRWTILGQSFGGFCAVTYLSFAPQGLHSALITGGLPPLGKGCTADAVYRACFQQVQHQNDKFYKRFPQDVEIVRDVVNYLAESEGGGVFLPSGGLLTPRGLQTLGLAALGSSAGFERLHFMFEGVWEPTLVPGAPRCISYLFLKDGLFELKALFVDAFGASSQWSANKVRDEFDDIFDPMKAARENRPILFTGELLAETDAAASDSETLNAMSKENPKLNKEENVGGYFESVQGIKQGLERVL
ncbi:hypothetical protein ACLOJK_041389 [Asimina triloba]